MDRVRTYGLAGVGGTLVIAAIVFAVANRSDSDLAPPEAINRGIVLGLLIALPAAIAALGVWRRDRVLFIAAAAATLPFAGLSVVTLPLFITALMFILAGAAAAGPRRRARWLQAVAIGVLQVGAIASLWGTTETRCWAAYPSGSGYEYRFVPTSNEGLEMGGPGQPVAGGCDGGALTERGAAVAGVLVIGELAIAVMSARRRAGNGSIEAKAAT